MSNKLYLRFESQAGGVSLFFNGFLLLGPEETGRSSAQIGPFLRPGRNIIELNAERAGAQASFNIVDMSEGDPETAPSLLEGRLAGDTARAEEYLTIETPVQPFGWHAASVVENLASQQRSLFQISETLAHLLERGPNDRLLNILSMKHSEIAVAVGLSRGEIDDGLIEGLANLRKLSGFRTELAAYDEVLPVLSSDGRIVTMRRRSGGDAIRIIDGVINPGFTVAMALIYDRWQIVR